MKRLIAPLIVTLFSTGLLSPPAAWAQAPKTAPGPAAKSDPKATGHAPLDLNSAGEADLKVVPQATYDKIKDHVIAKQK